MKNLAWILAALATAPALAHADVGMEQYDKRCAACHGKDGEAQTKMGAKLSVRAFTDPKVQEKLTREALTQVVGAGIPEKKMPAFKEKLSAEELDAVVGYVLGTFKKGGAPEAQPAPAAKPEEAKPAEVKAEPAAEVKPAEAKSDEAKPADAKPATKKATKKAKLHKKHKAKKSAKPAESKPAAPAPAP